MELRQTPELSALVPLKASLDVAEHTLFAVYPKLEEDDTRPTGRYICAREAYACAIIYQLRALSGMVEEFIQDLRGDSERKIVLSSTPF
jgi:hypothetical protein